MNNDAIAYETWDELEKELFTPEGIAASDLRVALISEKIKARQEQKASTSGDSKSFTFYL